MNGIGRDDWKTLTHLVIKGKERLWRMLCSTSCCPARAEKIWDYRATSIFYMVHETRKRSKSLWKLDWLCKLKNECDGCFRYIKSPPDGQQSCTLYPPNRTAQPKSHQLGNGIKGLSVSVVKRFDSTVLTPHRHYNGKDAACGVQKMRHQ